MNDIQYTYYVTYCAHNDTTIKFITKFTSSFRYKLPFCLFFICIVCLTSVYVFTVSLFLSTSTLVIVHIVLIVCVLCFHQLKLNQNVDATFALSLCVCCNHRDDFSVDLIFSVSPNFSFFFQNLEHFHLISLI